MQTLFRYQRQVSEKATLMILRLLKKLPITARSPRLQITARTESVFRMLPRGRQAVTMGLPALLFSIAIANPCQAVQVSNYASPPPTPITRAPAPDQATAATSSQEPARYAPPVHVTPPADYTARPTQDINHQTESVNGRRNLTRLVGYSNQATVTKLSDDTLSQAAAQLPAVEPPRDLVSQPIASGQYNGLHGYRNTPTRQVEPREQGKIRRPGLQDHICLLYTSPSPRDRG